MSNGNYPQKEKAVGVYVPTASEVRFNREWGGHRFTDDEVNRLLAGETISFDAKSKAGKDYVATGSLQEQEYNGNKFWGFSLATDSVPSSWAGHTFNKEEIETLSSGGKVYLQDCVSKQGKQFACNVSWGMQNGRKCIVPDFGSKN